MNVKDFASITPTLSFEQFFSGRTEGQGMFFDRFGSAKVRFTVDLNGAWDGRVLTLRENLKYDNGEKLARTYTITKVDPHSYEVEAADLVGKGKIEVYGNTAKWSYYLRQDIGGRVMTLYFDDWMHLQEGGMILNRAYAQKWGIELGEVFMAVRKVSGEVSPS